ncbi:hypothetical protein NDI52_27100 [Leptolyngbya sp. PL-A3]|nr:MULTISPECIES: hypothetical protein [unclassified Leptolyngbya]
MSLDLPLWSVVEASATLYEKGPERYHLLLPEPALEGHTLDAEPSSTAIASPRFLWLDLSPYRVILTMQTHGKFSYRHYWERGVFGLSRFWLQADDPVQCDQLRLRNYTRTLTLEGHPLPSHLRVEYELWAQQVNLGHYILHIDID